MSWAGLKVLRRSYFSHQFFHMWVVESAKRSVDVEDVRLCKDVDCSHG